MMKKILLQLLLFVSAGTLSAQTSNPLRVTEKKLSNGMTVWLNKDDTQPKVFGAVVVKAGAKDCPNTGIAHYFEHILFKGTDKIGTVDYKAEKPWLDSISTQYDLLAKTTNQETRMAIQHNINRLSQEAGKYAIPNEFTNLISTYGGTSLNAYTSFDETVFYNSFSPQYIAQWCEINSERLMTPVFRLFQGELETVYEEKNMYSDNMIMGPLEATQARVLDGSPYAYPIIGSTTNLKNPQQSEMRAFYNKYYVGCNMGLVLCGNFEADSIMPLLEKTFGRIKAGMTPERAQYTMARLNPDEELKLKVPIPIVKAAGYLFRAPTEKDKDYNAFQLALNLLSNDSETGLLDSLCNENKVMMAKAGEYTFKETGLAAFGYVPNIPFGSRKKADKMCWQQVDKLKRGDFSDNTLSALKLAYERNVQQQMEEIDTRKDIMINAISHNVSWDEIMQRNHDVENITKADIVRVANKYLGNEYLKAVKTFGKYPKDKVSQPGYKPIMPKNAGQKSEYAKQLAEMSFKQTEPKITDFDKDAKTIQLGNLSTLYITENPVNNLFQLQLIYHKGTYADKRISAVADYASTIGTDSLNKHQFNKALEALGAHIVFSADNKAFRITMSGFDRNLSPSLALLHQFMTNAKSNDKMFHDLVTSSKLSDKTFFKDNANIADAVYEKLEFGDHSQYLTHLTTNELKKLNGKLLIDLFKELQSNELSIVYSGKLPADEVENDVRRYIPLDKITNRHTDTHRPLMAVSEPVVYIYDNPSARQNIIGTYEALPAAKTNEQRAKMELWSNYFGGGMSSLLFQDIREFRAYAYYAYGRQLLPSIINHPDKPTAFYTRLGTQADKSMLALGVLDSLFTNMPVRSANIAAIKQSAINSINNNYPNFRSIGGYIASMRIEGFTEDPDRPMSRILPTLDINDVKTFYDNNVKSIPRAVIIVGNKKTLDMHRLAQYGKIMELKKEDIYK